ncbi:hypothetical protein [Embleya sp. NPDC005575]|uniref:hypothetical protein n=1 Tax=Embleya sp. NPDC005575 TaxID=3156892 RepID=UPI0033B503DE
MTGRETGVGRTQAGTISGRVLLIAATVVLVLLTSGTPARADKSKYPPADCLQVPRDLHGVVFMVYCPGKEAYVYSNNVNGCKGGPTEPTFVNLDGLSDLTQWGCRYDVAKELKDWLLDDKNKTAGHVDPHNIRENPCDALPKKHKTGCPDIRQSKFQDLSTHPCMLKNASGEYFIALEQQSRCLKDNEWFNNGIKSPPRGDKNSYNTQDYSGPPEVMDPLMEGAGWVAWACLVGCFFSAFWCLFQFVGARRSGGEMAHGVVYVFIGTLIVGGASSITQFVLA